MKKDKLELNRNISKNGRIRYPRLKAQADYVIEKKEYITKDGKKLKRSAISTNDNKIADTCIQIFQHSSLAKQFDYNVLREKAEFDLEERFNKYIPLTFKNKSESARYEKLKEIAIEQHIRDVLLDKVNLKFTCDYDEFIELTAVKSASNRIGYALNMLVAAQGKASYQYKVPKVDEELREVTFLLAKVATIPKIELELDEEIGEKYSTIKEFAQADIKNKRKHIKSISFELSKDYIVSVLGLGRDYCDLSRDTRNRFLSSYSSRLHSLIISIYKVQFNKTFNFFTIDEIQSKFGTNFAEYFDFKRKVLVPSISDLKNNTNLIVEIVEKKTGQAVTHISFKITKLVSSDNEKIFGIDFVGYYVSSRLYYFSKQKIDNRIAFAKAVNNAFSSSLDLHYFGDKSAEEWKIEAKKELVAMTELKKILSAHHQFFKRKGIEFDENKLCIVNNSYSIEKIYIGNEIFDEVSEKLEHLHYNGIEVQSPSLSLAYVSELLARDEISTTSLLDFCPFEVKNSTGWIKIEDGESFYRNKKLVMIYAKDKDVNSIRPCIEHLKPLFYTLLLRGDFKELYEDYRESIEKVARLSLTKID